MSDRDAALMDVAFRLDVTIEYGRLRHQRDGAWLPERRLIRLRPKMHARQHRSVLAHELAHAELGDVPTPFGPRHLMQERRADAWAALTLIDLDDYRAAETACEGHAGHMAVELGVMRSIVDAYRTLLLRTEGHTYVAPRMGAGQWIARTDVAW